jgi:hypothetical protein
MVEILSSLLVRLNGSDNTVSQLSLIVEQEHYINHLKTEYEVSPKSMTLSETIHNTLSRYIAVDGLTPDDVLRIVDLFRAYVKGTLVSQERFDRSYKQHLLEQFWEETGLKYQ